MFDKLDDLLIRFEEVLNELGEPGVTDNQEHFQKLMKEQSDLQPIVDAYREYKKNKETIQDSLSMLEEEKDEDMREMLKEELSEAKKNVEELEHELKILLLPKEHFKDIYEIDAITAGKLFQLATVVARALKEVLHCDGLNVLQNNGLIAGQTVYHFHMHLIPRYEGDDVTIGWKEHSTEDIDMEQLRQDIKKAL